MRILLSGSTGLIGTAFAARRRAFGDEIIPLVRKQTQTPSILWDPTQPLDPTLVSGFDAVLHLAGESVAARRWSPAQKQKIYDSRAKGTATLATALAAASSPPPVFLCASGINIYDGHGDTLLDESTPPGSAFLARVCIAWEQACQPLASVSRTVNLRIGVVLSSAGGTLGKMLPLFRLGLGGPVAGGRAYLSWLTLNDLLRIIDNALADPSLTGPINCVSPNPVTGLVFTKALAKAVHRPAVLPVPAFAARIAVGEMVDETVLSSVRAIPARLLASGFRFDDPALPEALASLNL